MQSGNDTTYFVIKHPPAGTWTITSDGVVPIRQVLQSFGLPKPSVHTAVTGKGRARTLHWRLRPIAGQRVRFVEEGKGVDNVIATSSAATGEKGFKPTEGPAGKRKIVAMVEQNGLPRTNLTVGAYHAPGPLQPARPQHLRVKRHGSHLTVSWSGPKQNFRHVAYLRRSDDVRQLQVITAGRRSATFPAVQRGYGATITVTGLTHGNGKGPSASVKIAGAPPARPAAGTWKLSTNFGYVRKGGFSVAGRGGAISAVSLTPGPSAAKSCGKTKLLVFGAHKPRPLPRFGLATWAVGRHSSTSGDGLGGSVVTVKQGHKTRHATLKLAFDGPRAGTGEVESKNCRLYFEFAKR